MGYKKVCLVCKRIESLGTDQSEFRTGSCSECSAPMHLVSQKFRPPKLNDIKAWEVAVFLISRGFCYHTIRDQHGMAVRYPTTMEDARGFVDKYSKESRIRSARRKHEIEKQIVELKARDKNRDRDNLIQSLQTELADLC